MKVPDHIYMCCQIHLSNFVLTSVTCEHQGPGKRKGKAKLPCSYHEGMWESGFVASHILMSLFDGGEWLASYFDCFILRESV
jgi:hypothetical protein